METPKTQANHLLQPHIIILPAPGLGHLIPLTELAKRLAIHHNFFITFIIPTDGSPTKAQQAFLESLPTTINSVFLPPVKIHDLPQETAIEIRISLTVARSLPALRHELFKQLSSNSRISALVVDLFGMPAIEVAKEFGIPPHIFYPSTATCFSFVLRMPELDKIYTSEYRDVPEPIKLPGCVPLHGRDLMDPAQDRKDEAYKAFLQRCRQYNSVEGILINSFMDLEPGPLQALKEDNGLLLKPPVYPVGPLIQGSGISASRVEPDSDDDESKQYCLRWLDEQPEASVLFVSFGSGGTLSQRQLNELAFGLEMGGQRFIWVVRSPNEKAANAAFFGIKHVKNPFDFLPKGFLERTKEKGLVVASWAPQIQILSHGSTGGFVTHCGWNSILESIAHGVPLIAWPLYAEQRMNAVLVTEDLKVAMRVKVNESGLVGREEIAKLAKVLIEGEEGKQLGNKMKELKGAAARALREDGSSAKALAEVAHKWTSFNVQN